MCRRRQKGIALLLALLVLTILIALVGQMTITAAHNRTVSKAALSDLQNTYGTRAAYRHAVLYLEADIERGANVDTLHEDWSHPIAVSVGTATAWATVQDAERKMNLSLLVDEKGDANTGLVDRFRRLVRHLGHEDSAVDRIVDYMDRDTEGEYETGARNARPINLEELLRIPGLPRKTLYGDKESGRKGIIEFSTLWPREGAGLGRVNANTAPVEILITLDDELTADIAGKIVSHRSTRGEDGEYTDFQSTADLKNVEGVSDELFSAISSLVAVKSSTFEIHARSKVGNVEKAWLYVVQRSGKKVDLKASMLENDFLWVELEDEE